MGDWGSGYGVKLTSSFSKTISEIIIFPPGFNTLSASITHITNADNYNYENTKIICKSEDTLKAQAAENIKTILKAGIVTTSTVTMGVLAAPMILLYELALLMARFFK